MHVHALYHDHLLRLLLLTQDRNRTLFTRLLLRRNQHQFCYQPYASLAEARHAGERVLTYEVFLAGREMCTIEFIGLRFLYLRVI
jgi:hypothetical protein